MTGFQDDCILYTHMYRREFIIKSATGSLLATSFPNIILAKKNKVYTTALIGSGWWGMNILNVAMASGSCKVVALCDVDQNQLKPALDKVYELTGSKPKLYSDYRELLEKEKKIQNAQLKQEALAKKQALQSLQLARQRATAVDGEGIAESIATADVLHHCGNRHLALRQRCRPNQVRCHCQVGA